MKSPNETVTKTEETEEEVKHFKFKVKDCRGSRKPATRSYFIQVAAFFLP